MNLSWYLFRLLSVFQKLQNKNDKISLNIRTVLPFLKKEISQFNKAATQAIHLSMPQLAGFKKDSAVFV